MRIGTLIVVVAVLLAGCKLPAIDYKTPEAVLAAVETVRQTDFGDDLQTNAYLISDSFNRKPTYVRLHSTPVTNTSRVHTLDVLVRSRFAIYFQGEDFFEKPEDDRLPVLRTTAIGDGKAFWAYGAMPDDRVPVSVALEGVETIFEKSEFVSYPKLFKTIPGAALDDGDTVRQFSVAEFNYLALPLDEELVDRASLDGLGVVMTLASGDVEKWRIPATVFAGMLMAEQQKAM